MARMATSYDVDRQLGFPEGTSKLIRCKARTLSRRPGFVAADEDDLAQELCMHLWRQNKVKFRAGGPWWAFANSVLRHKSEDLRRLQCAKRRWPGRAVGSLEHANEVASDKRIDAGDGLAAAQQCELMSTVEEVMARLPLKTQFVGALMLEEWPALAIARRLEMSRREVLKHQAVVRAAIRAESRLQPECGPAQQRRRTG